MCSVFRHNRSGKITFYWLVRVESCFDSTELYSGKCISLSLAKKMHLSTLKRCLSSRKSFVNSSRHLEFCNWYESQKMEVIHTFLFHFSTTYAEPPYRPPQLWKKDFTNANYPFRANTSLSVDDSRLAHLWVIKKKNSQRDCE